MPEATSGGCHARLARPTLGFVKAQVEHPRLLPGVLIPDPDADPTRRSTRDWIVDLTAFLIGVFGGLIVFAEAESQGMSDTLQFVDILGGTFVCLLLWFRRRWPLGTLLASLPFATFSSSSSIAGLILLFSLAVHRRAALALTVAAVSPLLVPIYMEIHPDDDAPLWVNIAVGILASIAVVTWGMFVRARRQLVLTLRDRAERAEAEQQLRVDQARQQERARIAREMHDVLAHRISLLSLHAGALEFRPDAPPEDVARAAGIIRTSAHEALNDLREVIGVLRESREGDAPERPQPTLVDLPALIEESRAAGMQVAYDWQLDASAAVPAGTGRNAYRIVQEGLTNARKHAPAAAVEVAVAGRPGDALTVSVVSRRAVGGAEARVPGWGTGLVGLRERVTLAGGELEHGPEASGHFVLKATLPW
jgi:signal transduction histidine kinase